MDDTRNRLRNAAGNALVIYAADKISEARELRTLTAHGLSRDEAETKRRQNPLVDQLRFELEALEQLPPEAAHHWRGHATD